jgi:hypothetical protein
MPSLTFAATDEEYHEAQQAVWMLAQRYPFLGETAYAVHESIEVARRSRFSFGVNPPSLSQTQATVENASNALAERVASVPSPIFKQTAFQCLSDRRMCQGSYPYLDCELAMIICICGSLLGK